MFPGAAVGYFANSPVRYSKLDSQNVALFAIVATAVNLYHLWHGQLCHTVLFTTRRQFRMIYKAVSGSALFFRVGHIVFLSSFKKVIRSDARRIVAMVTRFHTFSKWASIVQFPAKPVNQNGASVLVSAIDLPVTKWHPVAGPYPTGRSHTRHNRPVLVNLFPKSIGKWALVGSCVAGVFAKLTSTLSDSMVGNAELSAADITNAQKALAVFSILTRCISDHLILSLPRLLAGFGLVLEPRYPFRQYSAVRRICSFLRLFQGLFPANEVSAGALFQRAWCGWVCQASFHLVK